MRPLWKGSISFGLVNIPVKLYAATQEKEFKFHMLHKKDHSQIRYARICKAEDIEVPWNEIVKGYEYTPGEYLILDEEDLKQIALSKSKSIEILHFINEKEIDGVFFTKPYFLEPEKNAENAYFLLLEALKKSKKVGITKIVLHNREHLALIKPFENAIILNELRYEEELLRIKDIIKVPIKEKVSAKELSIALKLIDHLTTSFKPKEYKDTYIDELKEMINEKSKGKKIKLKQTEEKPSKIHDILSLLKASLKEDTLKKSTKMKKRKI